MDIQGVQKIVINLPERIDRLTQIRSELTKLFFNPDFIIQDGVKGFTPRENIIKAHQAAIRKAQELGLEQVLILEDDCILSNSSKLIPYAVDAFRSAPDGILFGGIYAGSPIKVDVNWSLVRNLCGAHFVVYKERHYDQILNFDFMQQHYDRVLSSIDNCYVLNKLIAIQSNGFSDNRLCVVDDSNYLAKYKIL